MQRRRTALRVRVHALPGQSQLRRVVVPDPPLRETHQSLLLWQHSGSLTASRADLWRLGALFRFAAVSPHSAVYVPLRGNPRDEYNEACYGDQGLGDLLIMRGEVGLRSAHWTALRARLGRGPGTGRPALLSVPSPRERVVEQGWDWRQHALTVAEHADTVFWSGTARALYAAGDELAWCSGQVSRHRDIRRHGGPALLSQWNGPSSPFGPIGRRDDTWECMILAVDPRRQR